MAGTQSGSLPQVRAAQDLERALGDPFDPRSALPLQRAVEQDEREEFPQAAVDRLVALGYLEEMVPVEQGGRFTSLEEAALLQRAVSRRDLTVAIALGQTFLGSIPVWLAGSAAQQAAQAGVLRNGQLAALALTEELHGADVMASDVRADPSGEGRVRLGGTKWLINNATRGRVLSVFAREGDADGLGAFSIFRVDKEALADGSFTLLPKKRTHGIRGADISGIELRDTEIAAAERIGKAGSGLDLLLQTLQISRIGCCSFALGAADTGLRIAAKFAVSRQLYGGAVWNLGHARDTLAGAFVDLLVADCAALGAARAVHAAPGQLPLVSAVVKSFVPHAVEAALRDAAEVLGARHYLREGFAFGAFQKVLRDVAVVGLFDGSRPVNLDVAGTQLLRVSPRRAGSRSERDAALAAMFDLKAPLPPLDPASFTLAAAGRDDVTQGLLDALDGAPDTRWTARIVEDARALHDDLARVQGELDELAAADRAGLKRSAELFALAEQFCRGWAACAAVHLWARSGWLLGDYVAEGSWLALGLARALARLRPAPVARHPAMEEAAGELRRRLEANESFGMLSMQYGA